MLFIGDIVGQPGRRAGDDQERRRLIRRDLAFESAARRRMIQIGFRTINNNGDANTELYADQLPKVVRSLTQEGWEIEAEGKLYRTAEKLKIEVKSGVDWFELDGSAIFGEAKISLPQLLRAIQQDVDLSDHMEDAVNSLRIVLAADESVRTGRVVMI